MRNPALHLVGIAASPGGGGVFGTRAEEELRQWLEARLDALGIDPIAYSRFVLSLLRRPDLVLTPPNEVAGTGKGSGSGGRRSRVKPRVRLPLQGEREQRRAVVQCLTSAAEEKCGVESLVDELCAKLRDLEGGSSKDESEELTSTNCEPKVSFETLTPRDRALRYYAAFPALQPTTPKKLPHKKERNPSSSNNNNNNINNNNNNNNNRKIIGVSNNKNNNNKSRQRRKTKISIRTETQTEEKEDFGFAKSMELERKKEQELELDRLRLAQLQAKFDESLEALWDGGPGNSQGTDSIWAAPSLSIPSGPLWPTDTVDGTFTIVAADNSRATETPPYPDCKIDDSPLIPWDIDLFGIEDYSDDSSGKDKPQYNVAWSDTIADGPWCWGGFDTIATLTHTSRVSSCFFPVGASKSPVPISKESDIADKANSIPEPDEDLLTSARTHFRPIKDDGHWADGTTFPVNNAMERVTYRRSDSGNLLYLPGGESPYMEYRESNRTTATITSSNLMLKFRVRQCDKYVQTEPICSPVKRRILSEQEQSFYPTDGAGETMAQESDDAGKDSFALDEVGWSQPTLLLHNERKRRHSSSFKCRSLAVLRPLTL